MFGAVLSPLKTVSPYTTPCLSHITDCHAEEIRDQPQKYILPYLACLSHPVHQNSLASPQNVYSFTNHWSSRRTTLNSAQLSSNYHARHSFFSQVFGLMKSMVNVDNCWLLHKVLSFTHQWLSEDISKSLQICWKLSNSVQTILRCRVFVSFLKVVLPFSNRRNSPALVTAAPLCYVLASKNSAVEGPWPLQNEWRKWYIMLLA